MRNGFSFATTVSCSALAIFPILLLMAGSNLAFQGGHSKSCTSSLTLGYTGIMRGQRQEKRGCHPQASCWAVLCWSPCGWGLAPLGSAHLQSAGAAPLGGAWYMSGQSPGSCLLQMRAPESLDSSVLLPGRPCQADRERGCLHPVPRLIFENMEPWASGPEQSPRGRGKGSGAQLQGSAESAWGSPCSPHRTCQTRAAQPQSEKRLVSCLSRNKRISSGPAELGAGLEPRWHSTKPDLCLWAPLAGETKCFSVHTVYHDFVQMIY